MSFQIVLCDSEIERAHLYPLVATRPIGNLRVGILTINEKWNRLFNVSVSYETVDYLSVKFSLSANLHLPTLFIRSCVVPNPDIVDAIRSLCIGQALIDTDGRWLAIYSHTVTKGSMMDYEKISYSSQFVDLIFPEHVFLYNADQILFDLNYCINCLRGFADSLKNNNIIGDDLYVAEGVVFSHVTLDTTNGPIYIGSEAVIESGVTIKGPVAICNGARVKTGAVVYPNVTIGDSSTVCGEINNTVIWGGSSKGHEGYLGCAVVGEGCNLGAGTSNSNLRNDWGKVKLFDYASLSFRDTGLMKCGVIIGDQSMLAIHSKINTGTVIGVGVQVANSKFIPKFVPDFTWMTDQVSESYHYTRFQEMLTRKAAARQEYLTTEDYEIFQVIYEKTKKIRDKNN